MTVSDRRLSCRPLHVGQVYSPREGAHGRLLRSPERGELVRSNQDLNDVS